MHNDSTYKFALLTYLDLVSNIISEFIEKDKYSVDFFKIPYGSAVEEVTNLIDSGYDVVLIYTGFGISILNEIGHSIVLIPRTDIDIIKPLERAKSVSNTIAINVHEDENIDTQYLEKLLSIKIHSIHYSSFSEVRKGLEDAVKAGVTTFVGGGVTESFCKQHGLNHFLVAPTESSIRSALEHAKSMAKAKREEVTRRKQLMAILKCFEDGVVCADKEGNLIFCNETARKILKIESENSLGSAVAQYYSTLMINDVIADGKARIEHIITIGREQMLVTTLPISIQFSLQGAVTFIRDIKSLQDIPGRIREKQRNQTFFAHYRIDDIKGKDPAVLRMKKIMQLYAPQTASVFIHGESGSGKELVAQSIHNASPRRSNPFVAINCAALPESLLESELFGYEEGAFTGARRGGKVGVFEMAHQGTLFLDEIGDMGASAQLRLLRVLETRELVRVGGAHAIPVDIRVISASHKPLMELVSNGTFRHDLFYRLAVLRIQIPPLRHRLQDLSLVLEDLLRTYGQSPANLTQPMIRTMERYPWPGNIRELQSFMESYLVLLDGKAIDEKLFLEMFDEWTALGREENNVAQDLPSLQERGSSLKLKLADARRWICMETVRQCAWNKQQAAKRLGISYNTLWRILTETSFMEDTEAKELEGELKKGLRSK